jgi:uncharacterized Tic20 family protein
MSDVPSHEPPATGISAEERQWAMFAHLSAVIAIWLGGMAFLGPLIVWLIQKDKMKFVDDQGKEALNFQLNILVLTLALVPIGAIVTFVTFGLGLFIVAPLAVGLGLLAIIFPVLASVQANAGEAYRYPYIVRVIK